MKFTGERLVPGIPRLENMITEELARLSFVRSRFPDKVILDAGSGLGHGSLLIAENGARWVLGVDISEEAVDYAAENYLRGNLAFGVADCTRLGVKDESFDMVCSLELIEHLVKPDRYLAEVCRVLKPQGLYFMSTPNREVSSRPDGRASWAFHEREYALEELRELLETYFREVEIWGTSVPVYDQHPIRAVTKSPLSQIKHLLPSRLRVWVSSSIRHWIKPRLSFDDVVISKENITEAATFVALCGSKRAANTTNQTQ
jgi:ubiquinone/menaquinone biosynthesis C-methylase UbiE